MSNNVNYELMGFILCNNPELTATQIDKVIAFYEEYHRQIKAKAQPVQNESEMEKGE